MMTLDQNKQTLYYSQYEGEVPVYLEDKDGNIVYETIDGVEYKGVLDIQKDETKEHNERIVFSLVGSNNETLWGVKQ